MPLRDRSTGSLNPTGAIFVVTTFSYSDGEFPSTARHKYDPAAAAGSSRPSTDNPGANVPLITGSSGFSMRNCGLG